MSKGKTVRKLRQTIGYNIRPGFTPGGFCHRGMESQVSRRKKRACETVKEHANAFLEKRGIVHSATFNIKMPPAVCGSNSFDLP